MQTLPTAVTFQTDDALLQRLYDEAERQCRGNLQNFANRRVLIEGGGYHKIWLETQPMGGEMYAGRDMVAALNNTLLFIEHQRADGRLPGSIMLEGGCIIPQFNKFQGFCFPAPALNLYYWLGQPQDYLRLLQQALVRFDAYLWRNRDSDGDGCLESFCQYDTGEDNARRYGDAPGWWEAETPPQGYQVVPMASMDVMCYSFAARDALSKISSILRDGGEALWQRQAQAVRAKMIDYLWSDARGACFDRDNQGRVMPTLTHNNLRCMYWGAFTQEMARRFVSEHLLNPDEFWTPMPLPSVAANDPLFYSNPQNDWSGQPQGLTYQRAIFALENYGYEALLPLLGAKLFAAVGMRAHFTQQFDPFTGEAQGEKGGYGPTMLAVLGYLERLYGVGLHGETLRWGALGGRKSRYTLRWGDRHYALESDGARAVGYVNGKQVFETATGAWLATDYEGNITRKGTL
ncbi:MAG: hypothetical protein LBN04_12020 [Oscillospiraceae bacterium]|jgi:hypothetical protein|nr:hypothetical protein [Oscillospiraceae bacterium]